MIRNNDYTKMLVGVGSVLTARYNLPDGSEKGYTQKEGVGLYIADGDGGYTEPTYSLGVTEKPYGIVMAQCNFTPGIVHRVYGTVTPVTETVHITGPGGIVEYYHRPGDLLKNEWTNAPVTVDGQGNWSVDVDWLVGGPKTIYAFCLRDPTMAALANCKITIEGFEIEPDEEVIAELDSGVKKLALLPIEVKNTNDYPIGEDETQLDVHVTGTCPEDAGTAYLWRFGKLGDDWNAYWQRDNTVTRDPDNLCPVCNGAGCGECCHTGLELDGEFYARLISYTGVGRDEDGELHYNHEGYSLYCEGYSAVRDGRFDITSGSPPGLQLGDWLAVMFISEQSREGTAELEIVKSYPPCLNGDTLITMADGSTRPLRELHFGDQVLSGSGEATGVISVSRGRMHHYHTLYTFEDGTVIDESADHRFYNVDLGYWAWLRDWRIGDRARKVDGSTTALVSRERVDEPAECFGLWTESRDYWAGGLLSGETMANQRLLADATAEQAAEMLGSLEPEMLREMMGGDRDDL